MSLIQITDLTFAHEGSLEPLFDHVTLQLDTRWRLGFIGRNGRGKTTFLQLLQGRFPYTGSISAPVSFDYFPYPVADPDQSALDVVRSVAPEAMDWQLLRELSLLELDEDRLWLPFSLLSQGEQTKALLAALFLREGHFRLIDEPTNHLDQEGRALLGRYLCRKEGFLLVSHDRAFLDSCVDHILALNRAEIQLQRGNYSSWQENKDRQDQMELAANQRLRNEISRLSAAARQTASWSHSAERGKYGKNSASGLRPDKGYVSHKAAKVMRRAKAIQDRRQTLADEKKDLLRNLDENPPLSLAPLVYPRERLMEARDLTLFYGQRQITPPLSFSILRGERVALQGRNGCGKSSLLRLISGEAIDYTGTLTLGSGLVLSLVPQSTEGLRGDLRSFAREAQIDESQFKTILRKLDFSRGQFELPLETYSAGQKKKVLLARSLCQKAHLYLWDEPLNYIDLLSRLQLQELLLAFRPTLLFVEHDRAFSQAVATKVLPL